MMKRQHKVIAMAVLIILVDLTGCGKSAENTLQEEMVEVKEYLSVDYRKDFLKL